MAISGVTDRGKTSNVTNNDTITDSPDAAIAVDKIAWVSVAANNHQASDGASTDHTITDTDTHVWTKVFEHTNAGGGTDSGVTVSLWLTKVTSEIGTGDVITCTFPGSNTDKVIFIGEFTVGAGNTFAIEDVAHALGDGGQSVTLSSLTSREYLLFGTLGREGETATVTEDADYTDFQNARSTGLGGSSGNIATHLGYRLTTLTADTYFPTETENLTALTSLSAVYEVAAGGAGSASPAVIARSFTVPATTQIGPAVDVQSVINRSFTVDAVAARGAAVDVQDAINRSFTVDAPTLVGQAVQTAPLIDRSFGLDQVTPVAPATDIQDVIARSFTVDAATPRGAAVDVQDVIARLFALDPVTTTNSDGGAGTASPDVIARLFTVDDVTLVGGAVDLQALIARSFTVEDVTPVGPAVDLQAVINRSFALGATTQVGPAVDVQSVINRLFALDQVIPVNSDGIAGTASPDVIALAFTIPSAAGFVVLVHVSGSVVVVFDGSTGDAGLAPSLTSVDLDPSTAFPGLDRSSAKS